MTADDPRPAGEALPVPFAELVWRDADLVDRAVVCRTCGCLILRNDNAMEQHRRCCPPRPAASGGVTDGERDAADELVRETEALGLYEPVASQDGERSWQQSPHPNYSPADGDRRCQKCGEVNPFWYAPNPVWNAVVGGDAAREATGVLCPTCFLALPAVRRLLADAAAVQRVRELADGQEAAGKLPVLRGDRYDAGVAAAYLACAERLREVLDGDR